MRTIVLLSGGLDSTVLMHHLLAEHREGMVALNIDYGQRHIREVASAEILAHRANIPFFRVHLAKALAPVFASAFSSQVGVKVDVPHGHYAAESMKKTIVPNRNMILLAIAGGLAESIRHEENAVIAYAAHAGDHAIYPDCRPQFAAAMARAMTEATDGQVQLARPFINYTKTEIVQRGLALNIEEEMALTYSCYEGGDSHCGKCGTCVERKEAFKDAEVKDHTAYMY